MLIRASQHFFERTI